MFKVRNVTQLSQGTGRGNRRERPDPHMADVTKGHFCTCSSQQPTGAFTSCED